jgi:hypothetical protein
MIRVWGGDDMVDVGNEHAVGRTFGADINQFVLIGAVELS